jgi:hypothetical protein
MREKTTGGIRLPQAWACGGLQSRWRLVSDSQTFEAAHEVSNRRWQGKFSLELPEDSKCS